MSLTRKFPSGVQIGLAKCGDPLHSHPLSRKMHALSSIWNLGCNDHNPTEAPAKAVETSDCWQKGKFTPNFRPLGSIFRKGL